jgi:hypothetical protein
MTIYGNIGYTLHATMVGGKMSLCVISLLCLLACLSDWGTGK